MGALSCGYQNLRVMSVTWNIGVFITFNIAVTMVRCSGSRGNVFYWISFLTFWKAGPRRPIFLEFNLELYQEKTQPQMLLALLAENESGKWKQAPLSFQSPHTYLESSTHIDRYMIIATLYFSGKIFSQTRFPKLSQRCHKFKYILQMQLW